MKMNFLLCTFLILSEFGAVNHFCTFTSTVHGPDTKTLSPPRDFWRQFLWGALTYAE